MKLNQKGVIAFFVAAVVLIGAIAGAMAVYVGHLNGK